ncbi:MULTISPECIES: helix-turn-helix domain-containing protein [Olivibacter]|uniref:Helix-turn-helix domain-containing protein n=1 Tax=Olivibacter jilunii TaxID=985016 RepID=A0ABW6AUX2_9SPHI
MKNPIEGKYSTKPPIKGDRKHDAEAAARFVAFRLSVGRTQAELSDEIGISRKTISQIERAVSSINKKVRDHMRLRYGMNLNWLDTGLGEDRTVDNRIKNDNTTLLAKISRMEVELNDLKNLVVDLISKLDGLDTTNKK